MVGKRIQWIAILGAVMLLLGACSELETLTEDLTENSELAEQTLEQEQLYGDFKQTVAEVQIPVIGIGLLNLLAGWRLKRMGLVMNGFVVGGLLFYTFLNTTDLVTIEDTNIILGASLLVGLIAGVATFFLYNLMALLIGGAIGTTLMGGAWLQVADNVPPQLLVFATTFISAMVMFVVFRLFLVAFSAIIGAVLLMIAVPYGAFGVVPVAAVGILVQTGIAWWFNDDIFSNLRGDLGAAVGESFAEVLGPMGVLRERQKSTSNTAKAAGAAGVGAAGFWGSRSGNKEDKPSAQRAEPVPRQAAQPPAYQQRPQQPQSPQQPYYQQPPAQQQRPPAPPPAYQQHPPQQAQQQYVPQQPQSPAQGYQPPPVAYSPPPAQQRPAASPPRQQQQAPAQQPIQSSPPPQQPTASPPPVAPSDAFQTLPSFKFDANNVVLQVSDGQEFSLVGSQMRVGRKPENEIVIDDPEVSGSHLIISIQPEGVVVWDDGSTNGTFLNGEPLVQSHRLTPQDEIRLGNTTFKLAYKTTPDDDTDPNGSSSAGDATAIGIKPPDA